MKDYTIIEHDPLFITDRLREIDKTYFVLYNLKLKRYEVHSSGQAGGSYCFSLPYSSLDERAVTQCLRTRRENIDKVIKEMDDENEKLQKRLVRKAIEKYVEVNIC